MINPWNINVTGKSSEIFRSIYSTRLLIIIILVLSSFSHLFLFVVFHWKLGDNKSSHVSRTLLSILSNYYFAPCKFFHTPFNWWSFTGVWVTTLARPCEGVNWKTSFMSSSFFLQQCPARLVRLIWMILEIGGMWLYSCWFVGCCSNKRILEYLQKECSGYDTKLLLVVMLSF